MLSQDSKNVKRNLLIGTFIYVLLIFRTFLSEISPLLFMLLVVGLFILKYIREGFTLGTFGQIIAFLTLLIGQFTQLEIIKHLANVILCLSYYFVQPTLYCLPKFKKVVGMKQMWLAYKNGGKLYCTEWFPLQNPQAAKKVNIKWAHTVQQRKMAEYKDLHTNFLFPIFRFFSSSTERIKLQLGKGDQKQTNCTILFSHGRTATPFMYTNFILFLAADKKILAPQHSEVRLIPDQYKTMDEKKKFREKQVIERGDQIIKVGELTSYDKEIILIGHSYGCSTVLTAYQRMQENMKKRVRSIILLDPWLFPLTEENLTAKYNCPILLMANQFFIQDQDIFKRNETFVQCNEQNTSYICWKGADHIHQCDIPFIVGTSLNACRNVKDSQQILNNNLIAISQFLQGARKEQLTQKFIQKHVKMSDSPRNWKQTVQV